MTEDAYFELLEKSIDKFTVLSKTAFRQSRFGQAVSGRSILRLTD